MRYTCAVGGTGASRIQPLVGGRTGGSGALRSGAGVSTERSWTEGTGAGPAWLRALAAAGPWLRCLTKHNIPHRWLRNTEPSQEKSPNLGKIPSLRGICKRLDGFSVDHHHCAKVLGVRPMQVTRLGMRGWRRSWGCRRLVSAGYAFALAEDVDGSVNRLSLGTSMRYSPVLLDHHTPSSGLQQGSREAAMPATRGASVERVWRSALVAVLLCFGALSNTASAQDITFVQSTEVLALTSANPTNRKFAQGFVTGSNETGYTLKEIDLMVNARADQGTPPSIRLLKSNLWSDTVVATVVFNRQHERANLGGFYYTTFLTYTAPANLTLDPSTSYFLEVTTVPGEQRSIPIKRIYPSDTRPNEHGWKFVENMYSLRLHATHWVALTYQGKAFGLQIGVRGVANPPMENMRRTAQFEKLPKRHDGERAFTGLIRFSAEPRGLTAQTVANGVVEVTGGTVTGARQRRTHGARTGGDQRVWEVTVQPDGPGDVMLRLPPRDCDEANAVCIEGEPLEEAAQAMVRGMLPTVSISAVATPVIEGAPTAFSLTRSGDTVPALTVAVAVSEIGSVLDGEPPASATFAAGSDSATLSVATVDDEAVEPASTVTAALSAGEGYAVDAESGSAGVVVGDDDAAPVVETASPIEVSENATVVAVLSASDADSAAADLSWSIPQGADGGADGAEFALTSGGALSFKVSKDFEAPDDADTDGDYGVTVRVTDGSNPVDVALVVRLVDVEEVRPTARFERLAERHDGETAFTVALRFSGAPEGLTQATVEGALLEVTGGRVTEARPTVEGASTAWEVTVAPDGPGDVTIRLPVRACGEANAVCIGGAPLLEAVEAVVPGTPMTARFTQAPQAHDGTSAFELRVDFSHEPVGYSYRTVRGALFDVEGARIERAWRRARGKNRQWGLKVVPRISGDVILSARATTDCSAPHAACDADGRKFDGALRLTIAGPQSTVGPVVSIAAPAQTPVTEGTALEFALARTGDVAEPLTVAVLVTESAGMLAGTAPDSVTFGSGSARAALRILTEDDERVEGASTVTVTLTPGEGYSLDDSTASADGVVDDDDAAPVVETASPIVVAENESAVATLTATDADTAAEALAWSIPEEEAGGADAAQFTLSAQGVLAFGVAKDFEAPDDATTDGDYEVTVRVTDGSNPVDVALVVRLFDVDDTAPALSGASVDGATLKLTFSETLDRDSAPPASSFAVTAAGSPRTLDAVTVTGEAVTLTLSAAVTSGQTVTVAYSVPTAAGAKPIQDVAGQPAAAFTGTGVTNATAALPVVSVAASTSPVTEGAALGFALTRTGDTAAALTVSVSVSETEAAVSGTPPASVTFAAGSDSAALSVPTEDDEVTEAPSTVTATLLVGAGYTVDEASGSAQAVVEDDDAAPVVETASPIVVAENERAVATLTATDADTAAEALVWSIPEEEAGGADAAQFALSAQGVLAFGVAKDFEAPDDADGDGDYEVTVRVSDGANATDAALVVRLADADDAPPVLSSASVDGGVLTLAFDEALDETSAPPASSFAVTAGESERAVDAVEISGDTVVVTFSPRARAGETVTVGYTVPTGTDAKPVRDAAGNRAAPFANTGVTNETPALLPVVSIAPSTTPVTEGTAAAFVLTRTGATAPALTVAVSVSEAGSVVDGAIPTSATFASGASQARLSVATVNDGVHEADAQLSAAIEGAHGYEVEEGAGSAVVDVFDDDAAATPATEVWSSTLAWTDLGNNWFGGFAESFSDPQWSEGGAGVSHLVHRL